MTINKTELLPDVMLVYCNDGDIELAIPRVGEELDMIRTKIKINVGKKYTSNDIHILQQKVFKHVGINATHEEIEPKPST